MLCSNELPQLGDASMAIAGRFVPLLLTRSWLGKEDHELEPALRAELPGHPELGARRARAARHAAGALHPAARRRRGDRRAPGPRLAGRRVRPRPLRPRSRARGRRRRALHRLAELGRRQRARPKPRSRCSAATCGRPSPAYGSRGPADTTTAERERVYAGIALREPRDRRETYIARDRGRCGRNPLRSGRVRDRDRRIWLNHARASTASAVIRHVAPTPPGGSTA